MKNIINSTLKQKIERFCIKNNIILFVIFGSLIHGRPYKASDVDIALLFDKKISPPDKLQIIYELIEIFEDKKIDIVYLGSHTDPLLLYEIFLKGKAIYEASPGIFEDQKLRAWKLYLANKKVFKRENEYIKKLGEKLKNVS